MAKMIKLSTIKPNPDNPRKITKANLEKLKNSITGFEKMMELRPIVIDENGIALGGNMRFQALKSLGYKEVPESWVKRAEDLTPEQKREFVIKDNSNFGEFDWEAIANSWDDLPLDDWGLNIPKMLDDVTAYSRKVESPVYQPSSEKPPKVSELVDTSRADELIAEIKKSKVSKDVKEFLIKACYRFYRFNYGTIAEYYSHANADEKVLFEHLALVIIDYNQAIEQGFIKMVDAVMENWENENAAQ